MPLAPIIKWVGGKARLLPELRKRVPATFNHYYEPFFGGGALFFDLEPQAATVGDMNPALVEMYITVGSHPDAVINRLVELRNSFRETGDSFYYTVRTWWNDNKFANDAVGRAAAFIFLNKTCFNGLWRVNRNGQFNTPVGDYKNPAIFDADALRAVAPLIKRTEFKNLDYKETTAAAGKGDFVYFDPPYDPINKTSNFTSYTKDIFGEEQQNDLARWALELAHRGAHVLISNNDTPFIRHLYSGFRVDVVRCARTINSKGDKRGSVDEVLITHGVL